MSPNAAMPYEEKLTTLTAAFRRTFTAIEQLEDCMKETLRTLNSGERHPELELFRIAADAIAERLQGSLNDQRSLALAFWRAQPELVVLSQPPEEKQPPSVG